MKSLRKLISLLLVLAIVGTVVVVKPGEKVRADEGDVEMNEENFPDANFREIVSNEFDASGACKNP